MKVSIKPAVAEELVVKDVRDEILAQIDKWGVQSHPNGTGPKTLPLFADYEYLDDDNSAEVLAQKLTSRTDRRFAGDGDRPGTWVDILSEEVFEAYAEEDEDKLYTELKQVAAVAISWMRDIRMRSGQ